jgi:maltokinase
MDALTRWLGQELTAWLPTRRWFAGKGRAVTRTEIAHVIPVTDALSDGGPMGFLAFAQVTFADGGPPECYQVPVGARRRLPASLQPTAIGQAGDLVVYDALADPQLVAAVMALTDRTSGPNPRARQAGAVIQAAVPPTTIIGSEQSNTSVVIGERYVLKVFRRIEAGVNPEAELQDALARAGSRYVAPFVRALEAQLNGTPVTLATVHGYVKDATDGWARAQASLRDLLADGLRAEFATAGSDFAAEAHRLGTALAGVHADLARKLGTSRLGSAELRGLSASMFAKLDAALAVVPGLARHEPALRAAFASAAGMPAGMLAQRIHGDLHLGQALRNADGWLLIDFEGEPAAPLADRRVPQSPLRDIAGMLRSIDYAVDFCLRERADGALPDGSTWLARQARRWAARNQAAFCAGYAAVGTQDPGAHQELLQIFQLEKAVYEAAYEARFRPGWVDIPLRAIGRILAEFSKMGFAGSAGS